MTRWFLSLLILCLSPSAFAEEALSLESLLSLARQESEVLRAVDKNIESLEAEIAARDILLSSQLRTTAEVLNDNRDYVTFARRTRARLLDVAFDQPFSTGTLVSLTTGHDLSTYDNFCDRNTGRWEFRVTQSLWRDAFGRFTELRHKGEQNELVSRKAAILYERQLMFMDIESVYWELVMALKEEQIRLKNIDYSKRLQSWTQSRLKKAAAERSDVLQADALMSSRELDLIATRNQIEFLRNRIRQIFPNKDLAILSFDLTTLEKERSLDNLLASTGNAETPRRLDSISTEQAALQAEMEAAKIRETLKPQLDAYVGYGQNGIASKFNDSWERASNSDFSATRLGVTFSVPLSRHLTGERERSMQLAAEAKKLQAQAQNRVSKVGWAEIVRQVTTLAAQVKEASRLSDFQIKKVEEERARFRLGRSTVFQLVTFEVEAAEAEVRKYRFLTDLRKAESQARLFTKMAEGV